MAALDRGWAGRGAPGRGCALRTGRGGLGLEGASGRGRAGPGAARWGAAPRSLGGLGQGAAAGEDGYRPSLCCRRKHKMDAEPAGCPASKKRLTEAAGLGGAPASEPWMLRAARPAGREDLPPLCLSSPPRPPGLTEVPCEEMEQAVGDQQCEAARRKLQEIEARITDEDEDGLVEAPLGNMPTLVLSDALKTGLKRDYAGDLTKKIIESMSRPSMELVLWKPLPEFLTKKAKTVSVKNYKPMAEEGPSEPSTLEAAFCLQKGKFSELLQTELPPPFYSAAEPAGCSEEEMEL